MKFLLFLGCLCCVTFIASAKQQPQFSFLLASNFDPQKHSLDDYYMSEKLDGVRAYWNGHHLSSRGGHIFAAPQWFIDALPKTPLDGELWGGRGTFDEVSGIVRKHKPHDAWSRLKFMVFELPNAEGDFSQRYKKMLRLFSEHGSPYWGIVEQHSAPNTLEGLQSMLLDLDAKGGEGFMLKSKKAEYRGGRWDDLLKVKLRSDAEATVVLTTKAKVGWLR